MNPPRKPLPRQCPVQRGWRFRRKFHSLPVSDDKAADERGHAPAGVDQPVLGSVVIELDLGWM